MAFSAFRGLFRLASAGAMITAFRSLNTSAVDAFIRNQYGGHLQYLTIQGLFIAIATMLIGVLTDVIPPLRHGGLILSDGPASLRSFRRSLFIAAMPLAVIISSIYWTLLVFFPDLIIASDVSATPEPTSSDAAPVPFRLPLSIDLGLHAVPALSLLLDFLVFEKKYSRKEVNIHVPVVVALYAVFYGLWVEHCASRNGNIFPYPFLTQNPLKVRIVIYAGAAFLAFGSFKLLNRVHPR
ncbi:hypothetical protein CC1G_04311 [Coprinopsis cinerea okayama7|uniref:FAR-17a/AIG1-like protein n=1 Tax=Coprinopsis cinerea (strain Okayama-7 / 130 / ATCC MYA-4618 / FGSC 9003) TaxID=240176 RepID=A8NFN6_COPC7|nr:hypothetical protein CC1G_04311 [Coprinopsis cinerea okayama7\|eukprot:XP_001833332.2 hypothetical protein CC1G_04311 [Coprinopsis cinerea okayama7\